MSAYVAFSGGIDSTALALVCPDATPIFTDTEWEHAELYAHLDRFQQVTGREIVRLTSGYPGGLPGYIADHAYFPTHGARYCTRIFKIDVLNRFLASRLPVTVGIGLRVDEPLRVGNLTEVAGLTYTYPLREQGLDRAACVQICLDHGLLPRYPVYMARGGCVGCFYKRPAEVTALLALQPAVADTLEALEETVQDARSRYFYMFKNAGQSIKNLRKQPLLFDPQTVFTQVSTDPAPCGVFCHR
jgi:hypothetical protein